MLGFDIRHRRRHQTLKIIKPQFPSIYSIYGRLMRAAARAVLPHRMISRFLREVDPVCERADAPDTSPTLRLK
jgi:hypothetical protein